jgi:membrane protein implicated in regulation of membrane protease activity
MEKIWLYWVVAGFLFIIIEIFTPGFIALLIGLACLITAFFAWIQVPFYYQLAIFALTTIIMTFFVRPYLVKFFFRNHKEDETNVHGLIGKIGIVSENIDNDLSKGRVKLGGEIWRAITKDDSKLMIGQKVTVKKIEGNKVIVEPLEM